MVILTIKMFLTKSREKGKTQEKQALNSTIVHHALSSLAPPGQSLCVYILDMTLCGMRYP